MVAAPTGGDDRPMSNQAMYRQVGSLSKQGSPGPCPVTAERIVALRRDVARLREEKDREIKQRLREARPFGDASDNDEYLAIMEDQAVLEARISVLEDVLVRARVVDERTEDGGVAVGSSVVVDDLGSGLSERYRLVGAHEPIASGAVSAASPIGQALLGQRVGTTLAVTLPNGRVRSLRIATVEAAGVDTHRP